MELLVIEYPGPSSEKPYGNCLSQFAFHVLFVLERHTMIKGIDQQLIKERNNRIDDSIQKP